MRCFIFSAGSFFGLRERPEQGDLVIAADAGYLLCRRLKLRPNLVVGDFDSAEEPTEEVCIRVPVEKDDTDTMLAVKLGLERGCTEFYFYGCTGGKRLDHTLSNLQTLSYLCRKGCRGFLYDNDFVYTVMENAELRIRREVPWGLLSLFSLSDRVEKVSLSGVQYPLRDGTLECGFPLGVSNHILEENATVSCGEGLLLIGWELPEIRG